jgi:protein regulator of cytokinesis 1
MQISLEGKGAGDNIDADLAITYPLQACLQDLKQRHQAVHKVHRERFEQIKSK